MDKVKPEDLEHEKDYLFWYGGGWAIGRFYIGGMFSYFNYYDEVNDDWDRAVLDNVSLIYTLPPSPAEVN